jgi:hypothetical protein
MRASGPVERDVRPLALTVAKVSVIVTIRNLTAGILHRRALAGGVHGCSTNQYARVPFMVLFE